MKTIDDLPPLLEKFANTHPEYCRLHRCQCHAGFDVFELNVGHPLTSWPIPYWKPLYFFKNSELEDLAIIQYLLQKIIGSHKSWSVSLEVSRRDGVGLWATSIYTSLMGDDGSHALSDEPAIALLCAYLRAVKAESPPINFILDEQG